MLESASMGLVGLGALRSKVLNCQLAYVRSELREPLPGAVRHSHVWATRETCLEIALVLLDPGRVQPLSEGNFDFPEPHAKRSLCPAHRRESPSPTQCLAAVLQ